MGEVNIGNRIFTDGTVTLLYNGKYRISSKSDFFAANKASFLNNLGSGNAQSNDNLIKATIDGIEYKASKEIIVDKNRVYVDGKEMIGTNEVQSNEVYYNSM